MVSQPRLVQWSSNAARAAQQHGAVQRAEGSYLTFDHLFCPQPTHNFVAIASMTTENGHPQRLTSLAGRTQQLASESYTAVKQRLPEAVKPRVEKLEEAVGSAAAPYVHRAQDTGARSAAPQVGVEARSGRSPPPELPGRAIWRRRRDLCLPAHLTLRRQSCQLQRPGRRSLP